MDFLTDGLADGRRFRGVPPYPCRRRHDEPAAGDGDESVARNLHPLDDEDASPPVRVGSQPPLHRPRFTGGTLKRPCRRARACPQTLRWLGVVARHGLV
jgi:hypothetical protein